MTNSAEVAKAYGEATKRLRSRFIDEFHDILTAVYEERGITVKRRLRGERKARRDLAVATVAAVVVEEENDEGSGEVAGEGVQHGVVFASFGA